MINSVVNLLNFYLNLHRNFVWFFFFTQTNFFLETSKDIRTDKPNVCSKFNFGKPNINGINQFHSKHNGILNTKPTTKNIIADINNIPNVGDIISQYILNLFIKPLCKNIFNIHTNHSYRCSKHTYKHNYTDYRRN